jgi:PAS domain-containing protein
MNGRWDILAANARAREVYGFDPHGDELARNLLRRMLLDPSYRTLHAGWAELAASMVGTFHFEFGRRLHDARYVALVEELRACAPDFRTVWDAFTLVPYEPYEIELQRAHGFERYRLTKLLGTVSTGTEPLAVIVQTPLASGASEPVTHSV